MHESLKAISSVNQYDKRAAKTIQMFSSNHNRTHSVSTQTDTQRVILSTLGLNTTWTQMKRNRILLCYCSHVLLLRVSPIA